MDDFSWSDGIKAAFATCLSCIRTTPDNVNVSERSHGSTPRADLECLLADVGETSHDAETLSLHSDVGHRRHKNKKRSSPKNITIFGYNVFGKPSIKLEGEDHLNIGVHSGHASRRTISSSTLDLDAAPLDSSTIERLSIAQLEERMALEEQERRRKDDRRRRRRERKELQRVPLSLASNPEHEFEGFPASTRATYAHTPVPSAPRSEDEFVQISPVDAEVEDADLEAEMYTVRSSGKSRRTDSDSRSRTSGSISNPDLRYNHHHISQHLGLTPPPDKSRTMGLAQVPDEDLRRSRKSTRSKTSSKTSSKSSQSVSLLSPVDSSSPLQPTIVSNDQDTFEGYPDDESFPIVGFGGGKTRKSYSDMGVALARRGDD
jgi:hypothetical protein